VDLPSSILLLHFDTPLLPSLILMLKSVDLLELTLSANRGQNLFM